MSTERKRCRVRPDPSLVQWSAWKPFEVDYRFLIGDNWFCPGKSHLMNLSASWHYWMTDLITHNGSEIPAWLSKRDVIWMWGYGSQIHRKDFISEIYEHIIPRWHACCCTQRIPDKASLSVYVISQLQANLGTFIFSCGKYFISLQNYGIQVLILCIIMTSN